MRAPPNPREVLCLLPGMESFCSRKPNAESPWRSLAQVVDFGRGRVTGYITFFPPQTSNSSSLESGGWDLNLSIDIH